EVVFDQQKSRYACGRNHEIGKDHDHKNHHHQVHDEVESGYQPQVVSTKQRRDMTPALVVPLDPPRALTQKRTPPDQTLLRNKRVAAIAKAPTMLDQTE